LVPLVSWRVLFFSQAEDGMRDGSVTGVQPCALPISVTLFEADARVKARGLEVRAEIASVWIGGHHRLNRALAADAMANMQPFDEIGRASCRERGERSAAAGIVRKKERGRSRVRGRAA